MSSVSFVKKAVIPALVGAGICLFLQRSSFFSLFFLVPLGFLALRYEFRVTWIAIGIAVLGKALLSGINAVYLDFPFHVFFPDIIYFSAMVLIFAWIIAPPPGYSEKIPSGVRFIAGSCLGGLVFIGIFFNALSTQLFSEGVYSLINTLISFYSSSGADVVQNAMFESISAETVLNIIKLIVLRGGSLVSCILLFFVSRQISLLLSRILRKERGTDTAETASPAMNTLTVFRVYPVMAWVLSFSLLLVVLARVAKLEIPEIILWNILILCAILYFAQGLGIIFFFLARITSPFMRLAFNILFIVLLFSPVINAVLLGGVILLGIAENWVPFRIPKTNGQSSTPKTGDDEN